VNPIKWSANQNMNSPVDPLSLYSAQANAIKPTSRQALQSSPVEVERSKGGENYYKFHSENRADARMREQQDRMDNRSATEFGQNMARDSVANSRRESAANKRYERERKLAEEAQEVAEALQDRQLDKSKDLETWKQNTPNAVAKRKQDTAYHQARMASTHFNTILSLDKLVQEGGEVNKGAVLDQHATNYAMVAAELKRELEVETAESILSIRETEVDGSGSWYSLDGDYSGIEYIAEQMKAGAIPQFNGIMAEEIQGKYNGMNSEEKVEFLNHAASYDENLMTQKNQYENSPKYDRKLEAINNAEKAAMDMRRAAKGMTPANAQLRISQINEQLEALHPIMVNLLKDAQTSTWSNPPQIAPAQLPPRPSSTPAPFNGQNQGSSQPQPQPQQPQPQQPQPQQPQPGVGPGFTLDTRDPTTPAQVPAQNPATPDQTSTAPPDPIDAAAGLNLIKPSHLNKRNRNRPSR
jgi:hypothetical protein